MNSKMSKVAKKAKKKLKKVKRRLRKLRSRPNIRRRVATRSRIPLANYPTFQSKFRIVSQDSNSMRVTGKDLVYAIPEAYLDNDDVSVVCCIPANPAYWMGTRVSNLAAGYQNYRPLKFNVHYMPRCNALTQGNVIAGTLWDQVPRESNMQQSLKTSNGGMMTQCFRKSLSRVKLKGALQQNLYKIAGKFDEKSNPFYYVALGIGCLNQNKERVYPGVFYVDYTYVFKNPIGNNAYYNNTGLIKLKDIVYYTNTTIITCASLPNNYPPIEALSIIQVDKKLNGEYQYTYNDQPVDVGEETMVWAFQNQPQSIAQPKLRSVQNLKVGLEDWVAANIQEGASLQISASKAYWTEIDENTSRLVVVLNGSVTVTGPKKIFMLDDVTKIDKFWNNFIIKGIKCYNFSIAIDLTQDLYNKTETKVEQI